MYPGSGRLPGVGSGNPLQDSCLGNIMDRGAWQATVHGVKNSRTRLKWLSTQSHFIHNNFISTCNQHNHWDVTLVSLVFLGGGICFLHSVFEIRNVFSFKALVWASHVSSAQSPPVASSHQNEQLRFRQELMLLSCSIKPRQLGKQARIQRWNKLQPERLEPAARGKSSQKLRGILGVPF